MRHPMSTAPLTRAEATRRFVQFAARYAIIHHVGWLLDAGVELGLMTEEVDINGEFSVHLLPWVGQRPRKRRRRRKQKPQAARRDEQRPKVDTYAPAANVVPIRKASPVEVDRLRAKGMTHKVIAERLGVSTKTVQRLLKEADKK